MCRFPVWLVSALSSEALPLWLSVAAEAAVAVVIWLELRANRRMQFLEKITSEERNEERATIYQTFLETRSNPQQDGQQFLDKIYKEQCLKAKCDRQIELFNLLGLIVKRPNPKNEYVKVFPHAAIYIWIILGPYIERRRQDAGSSFAEPMLKFTFACSEYLLMKGRRLHLRQANGKDGLIIEVSELGNL